MPAPTVVTSPQRRNTAVYVGPKRSSVSAVAVQRYSEEDDDVSDDPAWYHAPRESLQPVLPMSVLQKQESQRSDSTASESSDPISPQWVTSPNNLKAEMRTVASSGAEADDEDDDDDDEDNQEDDYFPPEPTTKRTATRPSRPSLAISTSGRGSLSSSSSSPSPQQSVTSPPGRAAVPVKLRARGSTSKLSDVKRLSLERLSGSDATSSRPSSDSEDRPHRGRPSYQKPYTRQSIDMTRGSLDMGGRDSMMQYRPSDLNVQDLKANFSRRDSLAALHDGSAPVSRGSISHAPRQSDAELPELLRAAKTGNMMLLKAALQDRETDVTQRDAVHGQTALHLAVRNGQFAAVRLLCQKKYVKLLVDAVDTRNNTPLHLATARSRRITKFLLEQGGADVTKVNSRGQTPLAVNILTTRTDDPLVAEMLLMHKADANAALENSTILHKAVELKLHEIACRLVRYGARLDVKDENGKMVFDKVNRKVLRQLINKISFPPVWVPNEERSHCMLCSRKFSKFYIGVRRHHCRHCGRICCGQCSHVSVESVAFPKSFEDRLKKGAAAGNDDKKRVCKTCSSVFKEREQPNDAKRKMSGFMKNAFGNEWEEVHGQQNVPRRSSLAV